MSIKCRLFPACPLLALGLSVSALFSGVASAEKAVQQDVASSPETTNEVDFPALLGRVKESGVGSLKEKELVDFNGAVREQLVKARIEGQAIRYAFESENAEARQLQADITALQNQVVEKRRQLDAMMTKQDAYQALIAKEKEMVALLSESTQALSKDKVSQDEAKPQTP